jgi:hypothetical protein
MLNRLARVNLREQSAIGTRQEDGGGAGKGVPCVNLKRIKISASGCGKDNY